MKNGLLFLLVLLLPSTVPKAEGPKRKQGREID
jgi:hypothetical protein